MQWAINREEFMKNILACENTGSIYLIKKDFSDKMKEQDYLRGSLTSAELVKRVFNNPESYKKRGLLKKYKTIPLNERTRCNYFFFDSDLIIIHGREFPFKSTDVFFDEKYGFYSLIVDYGDGDQRQVFFNYYSQLLGNKIVTNWGYDYGFYWD